MIIEKYHFGSITILGKTYHHDVEVRWTGEVLRWQRKESHVFDIEDVSRALLENPDTIILGTGAYGVAKVPERTQEFVESKGVKLIIDRTGEAVKTFNIINGASAKEEGKQNKVIGLFHLTC